MRRVVVDAGHGGTDPGGRSLGTPEKTLALRYALRLGKYLQMGGARVIYTRTTDVFVPLKQRAEIANEADADLFVSVHANANDNPKASGPWTLHAANSVRGARAAAAVQAALAGVLGGNPGAVYPDDSGWTGGRTLAVLRRTEMPAVLIELGFMTNAEDLAELEDVATETRVCRALADAVLEWLGVAPAPREPRPPEIVAPPLPQPSDVGDLRLEPIRVPKREHVETAARALGVEPSLLCQASGPVLAVLGAVAAGNEGPRAALAVELLEALGEYRRRACGEP
jgi:N-acetylmuramoyl-L-alanine amidase